MTDCKETVDSALQEKISTLLIEGETVKKSPNEPVVSIRSLKKMLSMLAWSIRMNWRDCGPRLRAMKEICRLLHEKGHPDALEWHDWLVESDAEIHEDGRVMASARWRGSFPQHTKRRKNIHIFWHPSTEFKQGNISDAVWERFGCYVGQD